MELLAVYDDQEEAEKAQRLVLGKHRLASDRDDNEIVWRLFGSPTWANFYALEMYELPQLRQLIARRQAGQVYDADEHRRIISSLGYLVNTYGLTIPKHWL